MRFFARVDRAPDLWRSLSTCTRIALRMPVRGVDRPNFDLWVRSFNE
jgi:hypothetical protein